MRFSFLFKFVAMFAGILALAVSAYYLRSTQRFVEGAVRGTGVVVDLIESKTGSRRTTVYKPHIRFTANDGSIVDFDGTVASNPPTYAKGDTVAILYRPGEANSARIDNFFGIWGGVFISAVLGVAFILAGAILFFVDAKKSNPEGP